jgi:hypothetical protein
MDLMPQQAYPYVIVSHVTDTLLIPIITASLSSSRFLGHATLLPHAGTLFTLFE